MGPSGQPRNNTFCCRFRFLPKRLLAAHGGLFEDLRVPVAHFWVCPSGMRSPGERVWEWGKYIQGPLHSLSKTLAHGAAEGAPRIPPGPFYNMLAGWLLYLVPAVLGKALLGSVSVTLAGPWGPEITFRREFGRPNAPQKGPVGPQKVPQRTPREVNG